MTSIRSRVLELVEVGIVHSVVELFLRQTLCLSLCLFTPELVTCLVTQMWLTVDRLASVRINKPSVRRSWGSCYNFVSHTLANVRSVLP